jgi:hypothetical protein
MGRKGNELVDSPIVVHDSMISIITMTSTPTMRVVGGLGVTYGAGQNVLDRLAS